MTRRNRQQTRKALTAHTRRQGHERALAQTSDPQDKARLTAAYSRETLGYVPIRDRQAHYLCDLGLRDANRGPRVPEGHQPRPEIIRTRPRRTGRQAA